MSLRREAGARPDAGGIETLAPDGEEAICDGRLRWSSEMVAVMAVGYDYSYEGFTCVESRTPVPGAISGHICPCLPNITPPAFSSLPYPFSLRLSPSPSDPIDAVSYRDTKTCSSPCTRQRPHPSDRSSALLLNGKRHVISLIWAPTSVSEKRWWVATDWKGHGQSSPPHGPIPAGDVPKGLRRATCMPLVSGHGTVQRWEFHASLASCPRRRGILASCARGRACGTERKSPA